MATDFGLSMQWMYYFWSLNHVYDLFKFSSFVIIETWLCYNSEDNTCCEKSAFIAVYFANLQRCSHGGMHDTDVLNQSFSHLMSRLHHTSDGCILLFQALPVFLDSLISAWGAILISVTLILLFGEVMRLCSCRIGVCWIIIAVNFTFYAIYQIKLWIV